MPRIDMDEYNAASESSGGGFAQMLPGAYVVRIQAVRTEGDTKSGGHWTSDEKKYVKLVYDIAEGEFAGKYSDDYFTDLKGNPLEERDYAHCHYLSWKNMGYLKRQLNAITASNRGFDALAAFRADKWDMFVGKLFGVVLDGEVDTNDRGYDRWRFSVGDVVSADDARTGNCREPRIEDKRAQVQASTSLYDDVPFEI